MSGGDTGRGELDPQSAELLARMAAAGAPPLHTVPVAELRGQGSRSRPLQGEAEPVAAVDHMFVPTPTADIPIRIYRPTTDSVLPALVHFHGGGFVLGNLDSADVPARAIANRSGCAVVTVNYQKAPEHPFPIPLDDCYAATAWVIAHADELGLDPDRVAVGGDSAGGNLAAAVCLKARDDPNGPALAHQILLYPPLDPESETESTRLYGTGYVVERETSKWFWRCYRGAMSAAEAGPLARPLTAPDLSGLPPALIVVAGFDPLHDEGVAYAERLREAGVRVTLSDYPGMLHGFLWFGATVDATFTLYDEVAAWMRQEFAMDTA